MKKLFENMVKIPYNKQWIVEYFVLKEGYCPVLEFIESIEDSKLSAKIIMMIDLLENVGIALKGPYCKHINNGLFELRIRQGTNNARVFYFFDLNRIILTNGYIKKQNKLSRNEYEKALMYRAMYYERKDYENNNSF